MHGRECHKYISINRVVQRVSAVAVQTYSAGENSGPHVELPHRVSLVVNQRVFQEELQIVGPCLRPST